MHELSLAASVMEIAERRRVEAGAQRVTAIELQIGRLTCVEPMAMEFAMQSLLPDSAARDAAVTYDYAEGRGRCKDCGEEFSLDFIYDCCPACASFNKVITAGDQMLVKSITVA